MVLRKVSSVQPMEFYYDDALLIEIEMLKWSNHSFFDISLPILEFVEIKYQSMDSFLGYLIYFKIVVETSA